MARTLPLSPAHIETYGRLGRRTPVLQLAATALAVWRERRTLASLPEERRRDIGLSEGDVLRETARPIWDVPNHWRM